MNEQSQSAAEEIAVLRARVAQLEQELHFLRTHPVFVQGIKGEQLVAQLSQGSLTAFAESHDVLTRSKLKIEVKFSKLNSPTKGSPSRRWNWSKPLGWKDKGKDFDFLLLVGLKDPNHLAQYPDESPYVYFVVPRADIPSVATSGAAIGSNIQINTNLAIVTTPASRALLKFLRSQAEVEALLGGANPA